MKNKISETDHSNINGLIRFLSLVHMGQTNRIGLNFKANLTTREKKNLFFQEKNNCWKDDLHRRQQQRRQYNQQATLLKHWRNHEDRGHVTQIQTLYTHNKSHTQKP